MAFPTLATSLPIASLTLLSFCGWGPGGGGNGPNVNPPPPRWETGWIGETGWETDTDVDWDTDTTVEWDTDTEADTEADTDRPPEEALRYALGATRVAASEGNTCVIAGGTVECWGDDRFGVVSAVPVGIATDIDLGWDYACAVIAGGIACWGDDTFGQVSGAPTGSFTQVSTGTYHACAVGSEGDVQCWGSATLGKTTVPESLDAVSVSAGDQHSCAITTGGDVTCWGDAPTSPSADTSALRVWAGADATCVEYSDSLLPAVSCNLPSGTTGPLSTTVLDAPHTGGVCYQVGEVVTCMQPSALLGGAGALTAIARGRDHVCALEDTGDVLCWGTSERGAHLLTD